MLWPGHGKEPSLAASMQSSELVHIQGLHQRNPISPSSSIEASAVLLHQCPLGSISQDAGLSCVLREVRAGRNLATSGAPHGMGLHLASGSNSWIANKSLDRNLIIGYVMRRLSLLPHQFPLKRDTTLVLACFNRSTGDSHRWAFIGFDRCLFGSITRWHVPAGSTICVHSCHRSCCLHIGVECPACSNPQHVGTAGRLQGSARRAGCSRGQCWRQHRSRQLLLHRSSPPPCCAWARCPSPSTRRCACGCLRLLPPICTATWMAKVSPMLLATQAAGCVCLKP